MSWKFFLSFSPPIQMIRLRFNHSVWRKLHIIKRLNIIFSKPPPKLGGDACVWLLHGGACRRSWVQSPTFAVDRSCITQLGGGGVGMLPGKYWANCQWSDLEYASFLWPLSWNLEDSGAEYCGPSDLFPDLPPWILNSTCNKTHGVEGGGKMEVPSSCIQEELLVCFQAQPLQIPKSTSAKSSDEKDPPYRVLIMHYTLLTQKGLARHSVLVWE